MIVHFTDTPAVAVVIIRIRNLIIKISFLVDFLSLVATDILQLVAGIQLECFTATHLRVLFETTGSRKQALSSYTPKNTTKQHLVYLFTELPNSCGLRGFITSHWLNEGII